MKENKTFQKLSKFLFLLQIFRKTCRGRECHKQFHDLVSFLDESSIKFLAECVRNTLSPQRVKSIPSRRRGRLIKALRPHKKEIKEVIKPKISSKRRREIFQKGGGWFLPLITTIIPLIASLIRRE